MRVLSVGNMYPPHHQGGYELMWRSATGHLRAAGAAVRVLTTDHREEHPDPAIAEDEDVHRDLRWYWRDHEFPRRGVRERLAIERHNGVAFDRHVREFRPDVVAWWAMGGMSLSLLERPRRAGLPAAGVVIDEWMAYAPLVDGWQRAFARGPLAGIAERLTGVPTGVDLAAAAEWLFVSAYVRERAVAAGVAVAGSAVAHGGIDLRRFRRSPAREWGGRLLCLGRIDPRKGVETAVRALAELPEARLRCVGSGDDAHRAALARVVAELGIGDRVAFDLVARDEVPAVYAEADALLFCVSWPEPFGLVPLEAMAVGTPVIATGTGGSAEYLEDGRNCLLVAPDDPQGLAAAVRRLAGDAQLRERLRSGGLETAGAHDERRFNEAVRKLLAECAR